MSRARAAALGALVVLAAVLGVALLRAGGAGSAAGPVPAPDRAAVPPASSGARDGEAEALRLLRAWDRQRSAAWSDGASGRLRGLYVPGSGAGVADVRLLERYAARGLRVTGMRMQVLGLDVTAHRAGRWELRVTDRLVGARAVGKAGGPGPRVRLPRDRPSTRLVTLVRGADRRWRMGRVADVA